MMPMGGGGPQQLPMAPQGDASAGAFLPVVAFWLSEYCLVQFPAALIHQRAAAGLLPYGRFSVRQAQQQHHQRSSSRSPSLVPRAPVIPGLMPPPPSFQPQRRLPSATPEEVVKTLSAWQQWKAFHQEEGFTHLLKCTAIDMVDHFALGMVAALTINFDMTIVRLSLHQASRKASPHQQDNEEDELLPPLPLPYMLCCEFVGYTLASLVTFPLHMLSLRVRLHRWTGWRSLFSFGSSSKKGWLGWWGGTALFPLVLDNYLSTKGHQEARLLLFNLLGRPFDPMQCLIPANNNYNENEEDEKKKQTKEKEKAREEVSLELSAAGVGFEEDDRHHSHSNEEDEYDQQHQPSSSLSASANQMFMEFRESTAHRIGREVTHRGISLAATALVGLVHMPIMTVGLRLLLNDDAVGGGVGQGLIACVKGIWKEEGLWGFYRGFGWYLLAYSDILRPVPPFRFSSSFAHVPLLFSCGAS